MNNYLADTTVIIEMLRGNEKAKNFLTSRPAISIVTVAELLQGCKDKEGLHIVEKTCSLFPQEKIDAANSKNAIELMKKYYLSHGLLFLDALIAATCLVSKKILVTENVKDFRYIQGLQVLPQSEAFR